MSTTRKRVIWGAVIALVILLGVGFFFLAYEKVEHEVREPPTGEARKNPYLAAERLLNRLDCTATTVAHIDEPGSDYMVIFLADPNRDFSPEQVERWARWVHGGGHLIVPTPPDPRADENSAALLAKLGFEHKDIDIDEIEDKASDLVEDKADDEQPDDDKAGDDKDADAEKADKKDGDQKEDDQKKDDQKEDLKTLFGELLGDIEPAAIPEGATTDNYDISVNHTGLLWMAPDADWVAADLDQKPVAASRAVDDGRITVIEGSELFENLFIGKGEHATLLYDLVELSTSAVSVDPDAVALPTVEIVQFNQRQSWMAYVMGFIWPFLLLLGVALLWAIQAGRFRFGPRLADPPSERRSRLEHIDAMGRFLWEHGATSTLYEAVQGALMAELEQRRPALADAQGSRRDEIIAEELGISTGEARKLMQPPSGNRNADQFIVQIRTLERYRRDL